MKENFDFIEEFRKLYLAQPHCGSWTRASENCDYGDITTVSKDCYMCFNTGNSRDAYFCYDCREMKDCTDCAFCEKCELCYECTDCNNCYNSNFCQDCTNCDDVHYSYDLKRCKNCFGCVTLRDKQYCIFNEQYSKKEYEEKMRPSGSIYEKVEELKLKKPRMYVHTHDTTNSTGDYIYHSKNCYHCFDTRHTEDSLYIYQANLDMGTRDSCDCGPIPTGMDLCYDVSMSHYLFNCKHLYWCGNLKESHWCTDCFESEHLFGCNYLKNKQGGFYILNEEVEEDFYRKKIVEIQKELEEKGIHTLYDLLYKPINNVNDLPPTMSEEKIVYSKNNSDGICAICGKNFEITEKEKNFYKKMDIRLLPIYCPNCRAMQRLNLRGERVMHKRKCNSCKKTLISTYPPDSKYIVYCFENSTLKCNFR